MNDTSKRSYVPAAPGQMVYLIHVVDDGDNVRPTEGDIYAELVPVIAWRIEPYGERERDYPTEPLEGVFPVSFQEMLGPDAQFFFPMPDGTLIGPSERRYADLDEAKKRTLMRAQQEWDKANASKTGEVQS